MTKTGPISGWGFFMALARPRTSAICGLFAMKEIIMKRATKIVQPGDYVRKDGELVRVEAFTSCDEESVFTSDGGVLWLEEISIDDVLLESEVYARAA